MRCWRTAVGKLSQISIWGISVEYHTAKPIAQALHFLWVGRDSKAPRQIEELLPFSLLSLDRGDCVPHLLFHCSHRTAPLIISHARIK
jgi:hypothetical protein